MDKVYLIGGLRSFVGVVNGMYRHVPAEKLGAAVLRQVVDKYGNMIIEMSSHDTFMTLPLFRIV